MQVSFVIPLYNCLVLTQAMVRSLQATLPRELNHEIIFVDDGSTDGTRDWLKTLSDPFRVLLNERNYGYAVANNRGAALARGDSLVLLNNDLELTPHWLTPLLALQRHLGSRAGLVGNVQRTVATGALDHTGIFINRKGKPEHERELPWWSWLPGEGWQKTTALTGACLVVGRDLWNELGGFDERYVNGCEDVDLSLRALAAGRINAVSFRSVIYHHVSSSPGRKRRDEENSWKLAQRWHEQLVTLGARDWCRYHLASLESSDPDEQSRALTRDALLYYFHFRSSVPPRVHAAMAASVHAEEERWKKMFG